MNNASRNNSREQASILPSFAQTFSTDDAEDSWELSYWVLAIISLLC